MSSVTGMFFTAQKGCWSSVAATKKKGDFWDVKMRYSACFGCSLSHTHGKVGPMGKGQSSLELLFETRKPFMTRRVVICGGRVLERLGATGQHSRETRVFSLNVTCICFGIIKRYSKAAAVKSNVSRKCTFFFPSLLPFPFFSHSFLF